MARRKRPRWAYELWILGALALSGACWLVWQIIAPDSSLTRRIVTAVVLLGILGLASTEQIFDLFAKRAIRRACKTLGNAVAKIECKNKHYIVYIETSTGPKPRKCLVHSGIVKWL